MFWSPDSQDSAVLFIGLVVFLDRAGRVWEVDRHLLKGIPHFLEQGWRYCIGIAVALTG